jgi:hypothetical protein
LVTFVLSRTVEKVDSIGFEVSQGIDPEAEFIYVPKEQVLATAERTGGHSFDAPSAEYTHTTTTDGCERCTFETLIDTYGLGGNPTLARLAKIVHAADVSTDVDTDPAGRGLLAIGIWRFGCRKRRSSSLGQGNLRLRRAVRMV